MISKQEFEVQELEVPGDRLHQILDEAGFKKVRGRSAEFYDFLVKHCPEDWDLKASTVRSWFGKSAPPMKKIIRIIDILDDHYGFKGYPDLRSIQAWWKVGGEDPFNSYGSSRNSVKDTTEAAKKLDFLLPSIIVQEVGDDLENLSANNLETIKSKTLRFVEEFTNPDVKNCSDEYLKMAINYFYSGLKQKAKKQT